MNKPEKLEKRCEICGDTESPSNLVGWCPVTEMWTCERCCERCYELSHPYGCPSDGLDFDKPYPKEGDEK